MRVLALVVGAVAVMASVAGCGASGSDGASDGTVDRADVGVVQSDERPQTGGKLAYGLLAETNGWNPATNQWAYSGLVVSHAIFDTLAAYDEDTTVKPYLAEEFVPNADFTVWTIRLRPDVKLHNGRTVDSEVVVRNQRYLKASPVTSQAYNLVDSFEATGPLEVQVTMTKPWTTYPSSLVGQIGVVGDPDWMESNDSLKPIGTGPFKMVEWKIGDALEVERNADYWQRDQWGDAYPYLDGIDFRIITDAASREAALRSGDVDVIELREATQILSFTRDPGDAQVYAEISGETGESFVMLNTAAPPFDDVDARRALAYATDVHTFNDVTNEGLLADADGPLEPSSPYYAPTGYPTYDLAKAKELVETVKARHGSFQFRLGIVGETQLALNAQVLQQQWAEAGIDVQIDSVEQAKLLIQVVQGGYQAVSWSGFDAPDPFLDTVWWDPANATPIPTFALNFARWNNPRVGELIAETAAAADPAERQRLIQGYGQEMANDVPYVWLNHTQFVNVAAPEVVNLLSWRLPDGSVGIPRSYETPMVHQIWLRAEG